MPDPRVSKHAEVLVHYSVELKPGQQLALRTSPLAHELTLAVYQAALEAGAHIDIQNEVPGARELFLRYAAPEQLDHVSPVYRMVNETYDATISIHADGNTRELSGIDPTRLARTRKAYSPLMRTFMQRAAQGELRWCTTVHPTQAFAQEADMSLREYQDFVYSAGKLELADPVAAWREEGQRQQALVDWLQGRDLVKLEGPDIDLQFSIKGRIFDKADGKYNFPDGEIYTGPVEDTVNGWVRFNYPAISAGQEVADVELWFEDGQVVREQAAKNQALLTSLLNTDPGARFLGEWGIGTNYGIQRFTKHMLFDEKIGGTIHLALGASYPETGGQNKSGLHWDLLCDMAEGRITVDGDLFYENGRPVVWET